MATCCAWIPSTSTCARSSGFSIAAATRLPIASSTPRRRCSDRRSALWRGLPLADFTFDAFAAAGIARLEELRLEALEIRIDADLALGRHAALVAELDALTTEHPLRERLRAARMLALYRCGREPEALELYRETRRLLVDELGMEPSPALRELHDAILQTGPRARRLRLPPRTPPRDAGQRCSRPSPAASRGAWRRRSPSPAAWPR